MNKFTFITLLLLSLTACGSIDNALRSESSIKGKAAFALGTTPDSVTISNRKAEIDAVKFNATTNGKVYQCYYSTAGLSSDALCSPTDGSGMPGGAQCNALLKAANKC